MLSWTSLPFQLFFLCINDNKNFFWHYFFPYQWALMLLWWTCILSQRYCWNQLLYDTKKRVIVDLKYDNQVHSSFYTFFVQFISLVCSLQNGIGFFPIFSSFLFSSTKFFLHTLVGWWLFMSFNWTFFLLIVGSNISHFNTSKMWSS